MSQWDRGATNLRAAPWNRLRGLPRIHALLSGTPVPLSCRDSEMLWMDK